MSYMRVAIHIFKFLFDICMYIITTKHVPPKNPQVSLTIPLAQHTTMHPSRSLSAAQLAVNAELGLHHRSLMPLDVFYVWDFPTSNTVPHPSCRDALTCFTHSVFLVLHIIVYHECIYEACR